MKQAIKSRAVSIANRTYSTRWFVALLRALRRLRIIPPRAVRRWVRFHGEFEITGVGARPLRLHSSGSLMDGELFWFGDRADWEKQSRDLWVRLSREAGVILDVGANTGIFALLAKSANPAATVIAFEPQPNIYAALERNVAANSLDITCEQLALSDSIGRLPFYDHGVAAFESNTTSGSLNQGWRPQHQQSIEVDVTTLISYARIHSLGSLDLMKIDVETLEPAVLRGAADLITEHLPAVLLEVSSRPLGAEALAALPPGAYECYAIDEAGGLRLDDQPGASSDVTNRNYLLCPDRFAGVVRQFMRS